jgi:glycosyltransferase involved in cell wall biosynthesis
VTEAGAVTGTVTGTGTGTGIGTAVRGPDRRPEAGEGGGGVHLFVPMLHRRDAVGEHTRALRDLLVAAGVPSRIYCELPDPETVDETRPYREYEQDARPGDVLVYQVATCSDIAGWIIGRTEPVVLNYHSITPPSFFVPWNNGIARLQVSAQAERVGLAERADLGIGVSEFDAGELRAAGCEVTRVIPIVNVVLPVPAPDPGALEALTAAGAAAGGGPWWLSVGRLAPNKGHQDTIAALFVARATTSPGAHLTIVGSPTEPNYAAALRRYAADLGLADAVEFVSGIGSGALAARYAAADVLVMLSDHEGFGVPIVEAMSHGLPVVAFDAGAVAEVVGDAGVLLGAKGPRRVAAEVAALLGDPGRREALVAAGRARPAALGLGSAGSDLVTALLGVAEAGRPPGTTSGAGVPVRPGAPTSN